MALFLENLAKLAIKSESDVKRVSDGAVLKIYENILVKRSWEDVTLGFTFFQKAQPIINYIIISGVKPETMRCWICVDIEFKYSTLLLKFYKYIQMMRMLIVLHHVTFKIQKRPFYASKRLLPFLLFIIMVNEEPFIN